MQRVIPKYVCPRNKCRGLELVRAENGLICPECASPDEFIPFAPGTNTPIFCSQFEGINEYSLENAAEIHENALKWLFATFNTTEAELRRNLVSRLKLEKGSRVLVTGAGAGNDVPYIIEALGGTGEIYVQDYAKEMLLWGEKRLREIYANSMTEIFFSVSDAINLPFASRFFDAVYHFGGINLYSDKEKGISEMFRVVREGGAMVFGDEGIAPWLRSTEEANILINNTHLYGFSPPLDLLPVTSRNVELSWEMNNSFYVVSLTVSTVPQPININVPHVGRRGGTIYKRFYGQLEGVDPELRDAIYQKAEKLGLSRVDMLESLLRAGLRTESE